MPELYEVHSVTLTSITGDGRLSHPLTASIAIPANDNPSGVIAFAEYTYDTIIIEEGGSATISVLRSAGLFGSVTVQWQITPSDSTAFTLTTGSVFFGDGANVANFTLSVMREGERKEQGREIVVIMSLSCYNLKFLQIIIICILLYRQYKTLVLKLLNYSHYH